VLEDRETQDADTEHPEDAVLQPRVERRDVTIPEGQGLGEEELLGFVVLDRAGSEEPDADVKERVGNENGTERHPRPYGERLDPVGDARTIHAGCPRGRAVSHLLPVRRWRRPR
jgi:hypothetical protein